MARLNFLCLYFMFIARFPATSKHSKNSIDFKGYIWLNAYCIHVLLRLIPTNLSLMNQDFHFTKEKTVGGRAWL